MSESTAFEWVRHAARALHHARLSFVLLVVAGGGTRPLDSWREPALHPPEYQLKAAFLFNFAQFVEWPEQAFAEPASPLIIGVLGEDPFGDYLDETVRDEAVNGHPMAVERYRRVEEIGRCQILFVSRSEERRLRQVLSALRGRNVLTVGDMSRFADRGGMIRFVADGNRIRLQINLDAAKAEELILSSKLLRPAEIVAGAED